ncbi:MAG: WG repeat-containing protein [Pseudomonadota bacterium]
MAVQPEDGPKRVGVVDRSGQLVHELRACSDITGSDGPTWFFERKDPGKTLKVLWGLKAADGQTVLEPQFQYVGDFDGHGRALVIRGDAFGVLGQDRRYTMPLSENPLVAFDVHNGTYWSQKLGKWGLVDGTGLSLLEPILDSVRHIGSQKPFCSSGMGRLRVFNGEWPKLRPDQDTMFSTVVTVKNKSGFIDGLGRWLVPPEFDELRGPYSRGLIPARSGEKWGYINFHGEYCIAPIYDDAACFTYERARVVFGGELHVISRSGTILDKEEAQNGLWKTSIVRGGRRSRYPDLACQTIAPHL